jgi:thiol:disulfide interchange protein DsbA
MKVLSRLIVLLIALSFWGQGVVWAQENTAQAPPYKAVETIKNPKRWDDADKKVEVLYFFWYGCPTCKMIDPLVNEMAQSLPEGVTFRKLPAAFEENAEWQSHANLFWALQNLGLEEGLHTAVLDAVQPESGANGGHGALQLLSPESQKAFARANRLDAQEFEKSLNSPLTYNMLQKTFSYLDSIDLNMVPCFVINGRYLVTIQSRRPITDFVNEAKRLALAELNKPAGAK